MRNHAPLLAFLSCLLGAAFLVLSIGCSGPKQGGTAPAESELFGLMSAGRAAFRQGSVEQAATLYRQALMRARAMDNALAIGDAAYNLAACRVRQGKYEEARALLAEAKEEISSIHGNLADILLVEAKVARLQGKPDEALALAEQVLSSRGSHPTDRHRLQVHVLRGLISCEYGDIGHAEPELKQAVAYANGVSSPALRAEVSGLAGRIYLLQEQPGKAAKEFDHQALLLKQAALYREMVKALRSAGEAYMSSGSGKLAADRFYRAARSTFALGDRVEAVNLGKMAISAAKEAADEKALVRVRTLLGEIEAAKVNE